MTTALQICVNFSACKFGSLHGGSQRKPINFGVKFTAFRQENSFKLRVCKVGERYSLFGGEKRDGFLVTSDKKRKRVVLVRFNQGFGFNGGGGELSQRVCGYKTRKSTNSSKSKRKA